MCQLALGRGGEPKLASALPRAEFPPQFTDGLHQKVERRSTGCGNAAADVRPQQHSSDNDMPGRKRRYLTELAHILQERTKSLGWLTSDDTNSRGAC